MRRSGGEILLRTPVRALHWSAADGWRVEAGERTLTADAVVLAAPRRPPNGCSAPVARPPQPSWPPSSTPRWRWSPWPSGAPT
ncbi:FAD-dependent oxidoreductase [Streptomyces albulus]|nr:FAD-dependent oxidoreductase [Streptomyces noursei]